MQVGRGRGGIVGVIDNVVEFVGVGNGGPGGGIASADVEREKMMEVKSVKCILSCRIKSRRLTSKEDSVNFWISEWN